MIAKDSKFDWSIQVTWKRRVIGTAYSLAKQHESCQIPPSCYLFLTPSGQVVYFHEADYYCIILSHYLHAEVLQNRCLKKLRTIRRKNPVSESLFNQPVACHFFNKRLRLRCFFVSFAKLSRAPFLQNTLKLLLVFMEHICNIT